MKSPRLVCISVTLISIPTWIILFGMAVAASKNIDSPAGLYLYLIICLVLSPIVVPLNAFVFAPFAARLGSGSQAKTLGIHFIATVVLFFALRIWLSAVRVNPALVWTIIPFYLNLALLPPILAGSLAFSLRQNAM